MEDAAVSCLEPEAILPLVAANYDLPDPKSCAWLSSGLNDVFAVDTKGGQCILKVYRAGWRTSAEVQEEMAALLHLARKGVSVAAPIARRDGRLAWTLATPSGAREVVLFHSAAGNDVSAPDCSVYHTLGRALACMHNATDDFADARVRYDTEALIDRPLRAVEPLLENRPADRDFLRWLCFRVRDRLEPLLPQSFDYGYCHGDFRTANLRLDDATGTVCVFDFELGGTGFRAYDLAYAQTHIHTMARELLWLAPALESHEQLWASFLGGYLERRPLCAADLDAISLFVTLQPLQTFPNMLRLARHDGSKGNWLESTTTGLPGVDFYERMLRFLKSWSEVHLED